MRERPKSLQAIHNTYSVQIRLLYILWMKGALICSKSNMPIEAIPSSGNVIGDVFSQLLFGIDGKEERREYKEPGKPILPLPHFYIPYM
ncbi:hypothetical protein NPIL_180891 [Nephila pilipes]|uniref:Uncharacterized protein n=1 Tax=Nephila pilipes TaxID=299642 RepID=A0A8X6N3F7_NEPPI|nr:hypothetical protein NPIL_180891 [Nephila pilipes]